MDKLAFTYDDVCIRPDRQIGPHSHAVWELSHVIRGGGTRIIGDTSAPICEGEIILIPPNIPHVWQFDPSITDDDGNIANITILFAPSLLDSLSAILPEFTTEIDRIRSLSEVICYTGEPYVRVLSLLLSMRGLTPAARLPKMFELLAAISHTDDCLCAGHDNTMSRAKRRLENIRTFCKCNYARPITLEETATYAGMNKSAFCTFMRRHTGMTWSMYLNGIRLERAMEMLLHTDSNISDIAYGSGFSSVAYFNRLFRRRFGLSPKAARLNQPTP